MPERRGGETSMKTLKILHAADLHLDSAFEALPARKAARRRSEQRELLLSLAALAERESVDLVLLPGDLFDGENTYYETGEALEKMLDAIRVPVFIAPGNHDFYSDNSPYTRLKERENVHIFKDSSIRCVRLEKQGVRVFGGAFTDKNVGPELNALHADREEGLWNVLCAHAQAGFDPVDENALAASGMDYAALGHIHKPSGLRKSGDTWYSWPGCPEGRGFDETGDRFVNVITLSDGGCDIRPCCVQKRRYQILTVDVTDTDPLIAVHSALAADTAGDIYRILLTGEVDSPLNMDRLENNLRELFFELQLRDNTRLRRSVWDKAGEDTLRGLFLKKLREQYDAADEAGKLTVEQAARWGIAALDNMEEVISHDDP